MPPERRVPRHEQVLDAVGRAVCTGAVAQGAVLSVDALADEHAVSRSVVREVVRVLESMGLVTARRRVGITVRPRTEWDPFDPRLIAWRLDSPARADQLRVLGELRCGIEPLAARLAAGRIDADQSDRLRSAMLTMTSTARSGDLEAFLVADVEFHAVILQASGNEMLAGLAGPVTSVLRGRTHHGLMPPHPEPEAVRLHQEVAQHVISGDADAAASAMTAIVLEATAAMTAED
ncbi:FadR/GntR family transcriptional regulator [Solicola sp. PLA-1-18]|uniref:FadR/GntR family transcriptional regulator n=1 Tax=Solicola sp. PLA-1-18 TaxID=3380532 RepID=UPI003B7D38C2